MDLNALKAAVQGSQNVQAPVVNANRTGANAFTQSAIGHIDDLAGVTLRSGASTAAGNALYGGVKQQAAVDSANQQASQQAAQDASKQKLQDLTQQANDLQDPSKYYRTQSKNGGWQFYAPNGKQISATSYATVKGQHVTDALKGSQSTTDQQFLQDYKEVQNLGVAMQQGGTALQAYLKKNPDIQKQLKTNNLSTYSDVVKNFRSAYPQYFTPSQQNNIGNATYNNSPVEPNEGNGIVDKLKGFLSGIV